MAVSEGLQIDAQGRGLAADPADVGVEGRADGAAFVHAGRAEEEEQVQMSHGEGTNIGFQRGIGGEAKGGGRHFGRLGHGWGSGARTWGSWTFRSASSIRNTGDA